VLETAEDAAQAGFSPWFNKTLRLPSIIISEKYQEFLIKDYF